MLDRADSSADEAEGSHTGVIALTADWVEAVGQRFRSGAALALAETRLALSTFLMMLFLTVLAAGALLFAWGFLAYGLMQLLIAFGLSPLTTIIVLVLVHLGLAWLLWHVVNRLGRNMEFTETRRLFGSHDDGVAGG
jgi:hypothetical protein